MKKTRLSLLFLLSIILIMSTLTACAGNQAPATTTDSKAEPAPGASQSDTAPTSQDAYTVKILAPGDASTADCIEIAQAASVITQEKFNTTIELVRVGFGTYSQEVNLMLASGEKLDLMYEYCGNVTSSISSGQIVAINDALEATGKDMLAQVTEEDWACVSVDGKIYGVPSNKEKATGWGFAMVKEMADATGIDYSNIKELKDLQPLLTKIKELYPNVHPVVAHNGYMMPITNYDILGGGRGDIGSLLDSTSSDTTVINYFASDRYMEGAKLHYDWAQKGLIMPDASTNKENGNSLIGSGKGFGRFTNTKPGIDLEISNEAGKEVVVLELIEPYSTTNNIDIVWYVPYNSEKPERAVQVLNEIFINPELANLFINGIEGKHYVIKDAEKGIINFPDGVDGTSTGYTSLPWAWPNEMISYVWEGNPPDIWEQTAKFNASAHISPAKGFTWDNSSVQNEVTACANVVAKYESAIGAGSLDPEAAIPKLLKELEEAGADRIIAEKQRQLDEWLENR